MSQAPTFSVEAVELFERPVKLRMPFRFGVVTLTAAPQAFVRARIRLDDGTRAEGMAADRESCVLADGRAGQCRGPGLFGAIAGVAEKSGRVCRQKRSDGAIVGRLRQLVGLRRQTYRCAMRNTMAWSKSYSLRCQSMLKLVPVSLWLKR